MASSVRGDAVFAKTIKSLAVPHAVYRAPWVTFEIYRAKALHSPQWQSPQLRRMVAMARESYFRYGKRPIFDEHDAKAAIYLARAIYTRGGRRIEEWLTLRMVPGDAAPLGVAEPEMFRHAGKPIDYWMKRKIGKQDFWKRVASSSRMCGIDPYALTADGQTQFLKDSHHRYTALCFALIHWQFKLDYPLRQFPYHYITGMIRNDFYKKGLSYTRHGKVFRPRFIPAYQFLNVSRTDITADRNKYSYQFPLYWFDGKKLLQLVNRLRRTQKKAPLDRLEPKMFVKLAERTQRTVMIAGISCKPAAMRALIDRYVPDAPELKITEAEVWYRSMETMLKAAGVTSPRDTL